MLRTITRLHLASVDSTNSHAKRLILRAALEPDALHIITATEQTAGRGRLARSWTSSADDIKMTFAFRLPHGSVVAAYLLSPLLAVSACKAVAAVTPLRLGIKWPNDLIARGSRKVGGILCEVETEPAAGGSGSGPAYWAVLGIGLNVNSMPETLAVERAAWPLSTLRAEAAALGASPDAAAAEASGETGSPSASAAADAGARDIGVTGDLAAADPSLCPLLDSGHITEEIVDTFAQHARIFVDSCMSTAATARPPSAEAIFAPFIADYRSLSVLIGRRVTFMHGDKPVNGTVVDHGSDGALQVLPDGAAAPVSFLSGEVTGLELASGEVVRGEYTA